MKAILVAGLAFGDEAKGATVDYLCRQLPVDTIVRYNGGCQAAHNVVTPEGVHHTFAQFGAGMLASPTVRTHLSRYVVFEPAALVAESTALDELTSDVLARTTVDGEAIIITPIHQALNRLRERALKEKRHGSCGRGIGVARELEIKHPGEVLRAKHIRKPKDTRDRLQFIFSAMLPEMNFLAEALGIGAFPIPTESQLADLTDVYKMMLQFINIVDDFEPSGTILFEGAQGVMLDQTHGTAPHNTWTDTTFNNAETLLNEWGVPAHDRWRIGCLRSYYTRHGAGPFPTEEPGLKPFLPEPHNWDQEFAGNFRVGRFDFDLARKALKIVGRLDCLAISHLDKTMDLGLPEKMFLDQLWRELAVPVGIYGRGPTAADRTMSAKLKELLTTEVAHA